jgi:hypothetical protein
MFKKIENRAIAHSLPPALDLLLANTASDAHSFSYEDIYADYAPTPQIQSVIAVTEEYVPVVEDHVSCNGLDNRYTHIDIGSPVSPAPDSKDEFVVGDESVFSAQNSASEISAPLGVIYQDSLLLTYMHIKANNLKPKKTSKTQILLSNADKE